MKKVLLTAAMIFAASFANAQAKGDMHFGAIAGVNFATITNESDAKSLTGFHVGGFMQYHFNEKWALQPELVYSTQGASASDGSGDLKLDYINVPIMAKFYVWNKLNIMAGPQVGFLTSAKANGTDVKSMMNTTDFAVDLGAGYDLGKNLMVQARYNMGMTTIYNIDGAPSSKNSVFQLSVGYKF